MARGSVLMYILSAALLPSLKEGITKERSNWPVKCILDDPVDELCRELKLQVSFHCDDVSDRRLIVGPGCVMMRS